MASVASNLLMCTCAGLMGAASVPAVKQVKKAVARRPAVTRTVAPKPSAPAVPAQAAVDCATPGAGQGPLVATMAELGRTGFAVPPISGLGGLSGPGGFGSLGAGGDLPPVFALSGAGGPPPPPLISGGGNDFVQTSPAPEPEAWLMMVSGFGMVAVAMRQRRKADALAVS